MSWNPMEKAPKDGTLIVLYAEFDTEHLAPDVFLAFYQESEGHWDALLEDVQFRTPWVRDIATPLGWMEVPEGSSLAGTKAYRDGELAREPGRLHLAKVK